MKKREFRKYGVWLVLFALIVATIACGSSTPEPTAIPPTAVPPTAVPPEEPKIDPAAAGSGSLEIVNDSDTSICYLYVAASSSDSWGPEQLGSDNIIVSGDSFTLNNIDPDTYDLKAEDCSNEILAQRDDVKLGASDFTWTLSDGDSTDKTDSGDSDDEGEGAKLILENNTGAEICYLYIVADSSTGWGEDQLGEDIIPAGESYTIHSIPPGTYDLRVEDCGTGDDQQSAEEHDASIEVEFTWTIS